MQKSSVIRAVAVLGVIGALLALMFYNMGHPSQNFNVWNESMTMGQKEESQKHYIMYTDILCPFCDKFSNALAAHEEEFKQKYIDEKKVFFELRITALNSDHSPNSLPAAEGAYCAGRQNKFWDYYHAILAKLFEDYHSKGIGVDPTSPHIPELEISYFYDAAKTAKVDEASFKSCMENHETQEEIKTNTNRAARVVQGSGVPYFQFGNFVTSGFAGNWDTDRDWVTAQQMLDAGL